MVKFFSSGDIGAICADVGINGTVKRTVGLADNVHVSNIDSKRFAKPGVSGSGKLTIRHPSTWASWPFWPLFG
jgi:hypothetical protein